MRMFGVLLRRSGGGGRLERFQPAASCQCRCYSLATIDSQHHRRDNRCVLKNHQKSTQTILKNLTNFSHSRNFSGSTLRFNVNNSETASAAATSAAASMSSQEITADLLPDVSVEPASIVGEASLTSLGLGSGWPSGKIQLILEWIHIDLGLEWYQAILLTTLCLRLMTFPFVVLAQKNKIKMNNAAPGMKALQEKIMVARRRRDALEGVRLQKKLNQHLSNHGIRPAILYSQTAVPHGVQVPFFMSMCVALFGMANLPVASLQNGGFLWFQNLAVNDPFCVLPTLVAIMAGIQFRLSGDGRIFANKDKGIQQLAFVALPLIVFPLTINMPSGVTFYWACTSSISVLQALLLRSPGLKTSTVIPKPKKKSTH